MASFPPPVPSTVTVKLNCVACTCSNKTIFSCCVHRDWFEDELRAFQGGKDGLMPCVWESGHSSFPQVKVCLPALGFLYCILGLIFICNTKD